MDTKNLESIVDAIDVEWKTPAPSHANLARLTGMFFRELLHVLFPLSNQPETTTNNESVSVIQETLNGQVFEKGEPEKSPE